MPERFMLPPDEQIGCPARYLYAFFSRDVYSAEAPYAVPAPFSRCSAQITPGVYFLFTAAEAVCCHIPPTPTSAPPFVAVMLVTP